MDSIWVIFIVAAAGVVIWYLVGKGKGCTCPSRKDQTPPETPQNPEIPQA